MAGTHAFKEVGTDECDQEARLHLAAATDVFVSLRTIGCIVRPVADLCRIVDILAAHTSFRHDKFPVPVCYRCERITNSRIYMDLYGSTCIYMVVVVYVDFFLNLINQPIN